MVLKDGIKSMAFASGWLGLNMTEVSLDETAGLATVSTWSMLSWVPHPSDIIILTIS